MNTVNHIVTTNEFETDWTRLLQTKEEDRVYESYLGFYLRLRDQLYGQERNPTTFGFLFNTQGIIPAKSGAVFHRFNVTHKEVPDVLDGTIKFEYALKRKLLGELEDLELDFNYQRSIHQVIQPMPGKGEFMAVMAFYTPHQIAMEPTQPGSLLEDFAEMAVPGQQFYRLMNMNDNRVFALG